MTTQAAATTDLLQQLIRNGCVNDGTVTSGHEERSAATLRDFLEGPGMDLQLAEPAPGRTSLVARIEGSETGAPSLCLMGHTDVVPADPSAWRHDPFGAELIDGEVWGRGAIDMLNLTASMAVAFRRLADDGFRPRGDLIFLAVADEEASGTYGAGWLVEHHRDLVHATYCITEAGGFPSTGTDGGTRLPVVTAEKGVFWGSLHIKGTAGHASQPWRTDNALVTAAEVVRRLAAHRTPLDLHPAWCHFVEGLGLPSALSQVLLDPSKIERFCEESPALGLARLAHACTHTTLAPTVVNGGTKVNVIPSEVELQVDVRALPGWDAHDVDGLLSDALGDLAGSVEVRWRSQEQATASPADTPLWEALRASAGEFYPGASLVPFITAGGTDARFFRRAGTVAYGFGLFSRNLRYEDYGAMFHGADERVDVESLELSTELWDRVCRRILL